MSDFFNSVKEVITQKPVHLTAPHIYKSESDNKNQLEQLQEFYKTAPDTVKQQVERDMKMLSYGIAGEDNVMFELKNSYIPIIVLHDIHIEHEGLTSQIDFLIITTKFILVVECKNLIGNIEVNSNGEFIRTIEYNGRYKKEGIYSPITQNARHLEMIKSIKISNQSNFITKSIVQKYFYDNYKSVVVLANPKTVINMKYAKKEIKEQIIRSDQLISYIKKLIKESKEVAWTEKQMYEIAEFFLKLHTENNVDYTKKYAVEDSTETELSAVAATIEDTPLYKELKQFRYDMSRLEGVKPYFIYNNSQLENLISAMPKNLEDIKKISGFGEVKCTKYGDAILKIMDKYR